MVKRQFWPKSGGFIKVFRDFHGGVERGLPIEAKLLGFSEVSGKKALPLLGVQHALTLQKAARRILGDGPGKAEFRGKFKGKLLILGPGPGKAQFKVKFKGRSCILGPGPGTTQSRGRFKEKMFIFGPGPGKSQFKGKFKGKLPILV